MINRLIVSGFGGQGVMLTGQTIALAAFRDGKISTALPTYGVEQRGGSANITVIISDREIASPVADRTDVVLAMSQPAAARYISTVRAGGCLLLNDDQVDAQIDRADIQVIRIPCDQMAIKLGSIKTSNIIMMGAYVGYTGILKPETVEEVLRKKLFKKPELFEMNTEAFRMGYKIGASKCG